MRIGVLGAGLVGRRAAGVLADAGVEAVLIGRHSAPDVADSRIETRRDADAEHPDLDAVITATRSLHQVALAERWLRRDVPVVTTADRPEAVRALWTLGGAAALRGVPLAVGAAYAPGLSTLMAGHLATGLDEITHVTTARFGTGGPTCAREHHRSMAARAHEVHDGRPRWALGGSGRTLVWFPEPVGPQDCYRAGLAEPFLLQQRFPDVPRLQALQAATRRDRLTARLPMLRRPHPEGLVGSVWVEVRGRSAHGGVEHRVMAATAPQATGAGAIAALVAQRIVNETSAVSGLDAAAWARVFPDLLRVVPPVVRLWAYDGATEAGPGSNAPIRAARKRALSREIGARMPTDVSTSASRAYLPKVKSASTDYSL